MAEGNEIRSGLAGKMSPDLKLPAQLVSKTVTRTFKNKVILMVMELSGFPPKNMASPDQGG